MKLYWRVKRDGKWTYVAATTKNTTWQGQSVMILDEIKFKEEI